MELSCHSTLGWWITKTGKEIIRWSKRVIIVVVAVFIAWSVLDFVIHGLILQSTYEATASLWRPADEMKMGLMYIFGAIGAAVFVWLYSVVVMPMSMAAGLKYGLLFGIATGFPMGFGILRHASASLSGVRLVRGNYC